MYGVGPHGVAGSVPFLGARHGIKRVAFKDADLENLLAEVRACRVCAAELPLGPRPIVQIHAAARILIIGQAPAKRVHLSGVPWDDPSGDRLRDWLDLDRETFYSPRVALMPMGFCYPGRGKGGDAPPRKECAPLWHDRLLTQMQECRLTLLIGRHAQAAYLPGGRGRSLTEAVRDAESYLPDVMPLPHPSPRNTPWLQKHRWFETSVLPLLRRAVRRATEV